MHTNPHRHYRQKDTLRPDESKFRIVVEESDLWITLPAKADQAAMEKEALKQTLKLRNELKLWIAANPAFRHSLVPLAIPKEGPDIVLAMSRAATAMGVGPFAAVAGTLAQRVADHLAKILRNSGLPTDVLVENGGDTYLHSSRDRVVALLPDPATDSSIGLTFGADDFPLSLCASSATIGHSLSFGEGDLAVVLAKDGALADAAATAYGNMLKGKNAVERTLDRAEKDAPLGVEGVFLQCKGKIGIRGKLELIKVASR